jgi:hypothetical protein
VQSAVRSILVYRIFHGVIQSAVGIIYVMANGKGLEDSEDAKLKHLELIHNVIARLAGNSFWLKGWSVTLVAAIFAVAAKDAAVTLLSVAIIPTLAFWGLDAFYRGQEYIFREMHKDVVAGKLALMSMETCTYEKKWRGWLGDLFSRSVWPFHLPIIFVVVIVVISRLVG